MRISVGDVRLYLEVFGQEWAFADDRIERRPVLIGLHGGPGLDGSKLRYQLAPLAEQAQVVVPDQRGCGRSDYGTPETWNLATWATDVKQLSDALSIEHPVVLGVSFGGFVAQLYAATRDRLRAVRCPTLVILGEHDPLVPARLGEEIVEAIPDGLAQLELIPGAAHDVLVDNPPQCYRLVREFLADIA